ncbi:MAG: DNA repair protein RecO [Armatimonadetes bacterium]|nr:DNA repair protein RecO [Armatimonadota bacterium]MBS1726051.1 DNA repair protein RecO [Armatimonadota bacterium]
METTVEAIVLRRRDSGESDRRLTIFSRELGKIDVVAKGARKPTSRLRGVSEPLNVGIFTYADGKKQRFVTSAQPRSAFPGLRLDFDRLNLGLSWGEILGQILPYEDPFEEAFELCLDTLGHLESSPSPMAALAWGEVKLLELSGFLPSFNRCVVTGSRILESYGFFSPSSGGYVVSEHAAGLTDRYQVRAEVLYGLAALVDLDRPPTNLKFCFECLVALQSFWEYVCEVPLPARQHLLASLRTES